MASTLKVDRIETPSGVGNISFMQPISGDGQFLTNLPLSAAGLQKGTDIASASPCVIGTDGDYLIVTGTVNFSIMTVALNRHFFLEFAGILTMAHGAGVLDLPGGADITTAAGDVAEFFSTGANVVTCVNYTKA